MSSQRIPQIIAAMNGRQAAACNDGKLRDSVRLKLGVLAEIQGKPQTPTALGSIASRVCQAAARTIIFEDEVLVAMEMGAAGEFEVPTSINQTNCASWVAAYASSGDRRAAQEQISLNAARDRRRNDGIAAEERRQDFDRNGLLRAWTSFVETGTWSFFEGYGAVLYDRIGRTAVSALLDSGKRANARANALASVRRDYPYKYRTAPREEVEATSIFAMHFKSQLARAYFEELRARGIDISTALTQQPAQP